MVEPDKPETPAVLGVHLHVREAALVPKISENGEASGDRHSLRTGYSCCKED